MKKFIKITSALFVLLIIAAIVIPFLIPLNSYKGQIISLVKNKTGQELVIEGDIKASLFPVLGVKLGKTSLLNLQGYKAKNMVQMDGLAIEVSLAALLHKQLQIKQFILTKPLVNLEVNSSGKPNWELGRNVESSNTHEDAPKTSTPKAQEALLAGLILGDIKISDGEVNYDDAKKGKKISIHALNLKASLPSLSDAFSAEGNAVWNEEKISVKMSLAEPQQVFEGKKSKFLVDVKSAKVTLNYEGEATGKSFAGNVNLNIPSIPSLAKWVGSNVEWKGPAPLMLAVKGQLSSNATDVSLNNTEITLDKNKLKGNIGVKFDKKPMINLALESESLNLNPYLASAPAKTSWLINPAVASEFSNKPINLSGLSSVNAKVKLTLGSVIYEKIKIGKTIINADLNNGTLNFDIPQMALYSGSAKIAGRLGSSGAFNKKITITNVNAGELLDDLTTHSRFSGAVNASADLNGRLTSMDGMMRSLGGNGSVKMSNGVIKGIDLKNMANNLKSAFTKNDVSGEYTAFSDLNGTFTISQGIVSNKDLILKSPLLSLGGSGEVNLPMQTIHYVLNPEFVSTVKNADGTATKGLQVPIIISGSLDNPHFAPDVVGIVKNTLQNPDALKNTVNSLKEQFKGGKKATIKDVQDLIGGFGL